MGQILTNLTAVGEGKSLLLQETQIFASWTIKDVRELAKRFRNQIFGFSLVEAQFESIIVFHPSIKNCLSLEELFEILDNDHDGRIDGLELLAGLCLCCKADFEEKTKFCFELFDFNLNATLSQKELVIMMMSTICGLNILTGGGEELEPNLDEFERLAENAFLKADKDRSGSISFEEFASWARSNREVVAFLESVSKIVVLDPESEDSANDTEEDDLSDDDIPDISMSTGKIADKSRDFSDNWIKNIIEPTNFKRSKKLSDGPSTNMELEWIFGVRSGTSRGNVRYVYNEADINSGSLNTLQIVYPVANIIVVYDKKSNKQAFYQGHSSDVTSIAVHPKGRIVASSDSNSQIHIWDALSPSLDCLSSIQGFVKDGIQKITFNPSGDRIAVVYADVDHTIAIHNRNTGEVFSSAKGFGLPNNVYDVAFSENGSEMCVVGKKTVKFFLNINSNKRSIDQRNGKISHLGKKQTFFCVAYIRDNAIVGCASGELYRFVNFKCVQVVTAHGIKDPILSMYYNFIDGILVTGGKDGYIKTWATNLKEIGASVDLSEDLDGDGRADNGGIDNAAISVFMIGQNIIIGTRGSDVFEAIVPSTPSNQLVLNRIASGHCHGELHGLATHPKKDEFITTGDDKTLRVWSIRSKGQLQIRVLPEESRCVCYNNNGSQIAVGMKNGTMAVLSSPSLKLLSTWLHCSQSVTEIKFSPNNQFLASASQDGNIYLYSENDNGSGSYIRQAVCKGLNSSPIEHFDFSLSSQYLQSTDNDCNLKYWDIKGNEIKSIITLRDETFTSWTSIYGWPVQGIHSKNGKVSCCHAVPEAGVVVVGVKNLVNLYRYPSIDCRAIHQSYLGHSGTVSNVRLTYNNRHVVSVGGSDNAIIVWKHDAQLFEDSDHEGGYSSSASVSSAGTGLGLGEHNEAHVGMLNSRQENSEDNNTIAGDEFTSVQQWNEAIFEPTDWLKQMKQENPFYLSDGATDVDLKLQWVHGYRSHDCRNNLKYNSAGEVVYPAATMAVVYSKQTESQKFIQGAHSGEVVSLTLHPDGQIVATGEIGRAPIIIVWHSESMQVLARLVGHHRRGIPFLAFNPKGNLLASIGLDSENTLIIYEWEKGNIVARTPTDKKRIHCLSFQLSDNGEMVVTGGKKHLKYWWVQGQNIKSQAALWKSEKPKDIISLESATSNICVTGSENGDVIIWKAFKFEWKSDSNCPHVGFPVQAIYCRNQSLQQTQDDSQNPIYITGDRAGNVVIWQMEFHVNGMDCVLQVLHYFNLTSLRTKPCNLSVMSIHEKVGMLLIGTQSSEIIEVPLLINGTKTKAFDDKSEVLINGHAKGELWGLCCHPHSEVFFTCGDDCKVRVWSTCSGHHMIEAIDIPVKAHCLDINPECSHLAVGLGDGRVFIFSLNKIYDSSVINKESKLLELKQSGSDVIQVVKYSPDGKVLAVGSYDKFIYLYQIDGENFTMLNKCVGHSSVITHIDFGYLPSSLSSTSSSEAVKLVLQSNSASYELFYWSVDGKQIESPSSCKDVDWSNPTCTLGWAVQGIWPVKFDGVDINSACRSNSWKKVPVLATADSLGRVRLFNYPSIIRGAPDKCYRGHSRVVSNIRFLYNDTYCISTGASDNCVFVWATDVLEELRERRAMASNLQAFKLDTISETENKTIELNFVETKFDDESFEESAQAKIEVGGGDQFTASRPWIGSIREPSNWKEHEDCTNAPVAALELKYVYGYRGWDCRNNIGFADSSNEVVYHIAATGIVLNSETSTQIHNTTHNDDILCLAVHPQGLSVATGEIGKRPKIVVWDANTGVTLVTISYHEAGISHICFTGDGSCVISVGMDTNRIVAVHNAITGVLIGSGKVGRGVDVYTLSSRGVDYFLTGGKNFVKFWDINPNSCGGSVELSSKTGLFNTEIKSKIIVSSAFLGNDAVTGMSDGVLLLWKGRAASRFVKGHNGAVTCMNTLVGSGGAASTGSADVGPRIISGGNDGMVYIWNNQLINIWSLDMNTTTPRTYDPKPVIQAVAAKDGKLILGTKSAEIYEVNILSRSDTHKLVEGHFSNKSEVWGLARHPNKHFFATAGDDTTVRVWDSKNNKQYKIVSVESKARAVLYSPDGFQLAVGTTDGKIKVFLSDLSTMLANTVVSRKSIQCLAYSPDAQYLAAGSHDTNIYLLETKKYSIRSVCRGHTSYLTHLDFSQCSSFLQSSSGDYELLYWDAKSGSQIKSATNTRDVKWSTWTLPIGWPVQGIWPPEADGTDINSVDRSPDEKLIALGDDFRSIKLFKYPCTKKNAKYKVYKGHSEHVAAVQMC